MSNYKVLSKKKHKKERIGSEVITRNFRGVGFSDDTVTVRIPGESKKSIPV